MDCIDPSCSSHGLCINGECHCQPSWGGASCEIAKAVCPDQCSGHGTYNTDTSTCTCNQNWTGPDCSIGLSFLTSCFFMVSGICRCCLCCLYWMTANRNDRFCTKPFSFFPRPNSLTEECDVDCGNHGICYSGVCRCEEGWSGALCEQKSCHPLCSKNGVCKEGKCECDQGWTGEHCNIGELPRPRAHTCTLTQNAWTSYLPRRLGETQRSQIKRDLTRGRSETSCYFWQRSG